MSRRKNNVANDDFLDPRDPDYIAKATARLKARGVGSEISVGHQCQRQGWNVSMSGSYIDPNEHKPREIDVLASADHIRVLKLPDRSIQYASYDLTLVIEVKSSENGWAVIQASPNELPQMPGWESELDYYADRSRVDSKGFDEGETHTIFAAQDWVGARITEVCVSKDERENEDGRLRSPSFVGLQQAASATRALYAKEIPAPAVSLERALKWAAGSNPPVYKAWHPVLIHSGRLFRVRLAADLTLEEVPWAPTVCRWQLPPGKEKRSACLVDVVTAKALPDYLKIMRNRADAIAKSFEVAAEKYMKATGAVRAAPADY